MEEKYFSQTSVDFQRAAERYISQEVTLHDDNCKNLKS
jgi:hypothetical protein